MRQVLIAAASVLTVACTVEAPEPQTGGPPPARPAIEHINMTEPWPYPFSSAVKAGNLMFVSGQIGSRIENGTPVLVTGGLEAEARQTMDNIKAILDRAGSSFERVVKCSVMLADMKDWPKFNEIYASYFPGHKPARSAWGANGLALGARVEVECIALN
jgi:reactive intermediate/imine deaminase